MAIMQEIEEPFFKLENLQILRGYKYQGTKIQGNY